MYVSSIRLEPLDFLYVSFRPMMPDRSHLQAPIYNVENITMLSFINLFFFS